MPPPVDPELVKKEQEELNKVVVHSFTANPRTVKTFGTTTVGAEVTRLPSTAAAPASIALAA